MAIERTIVSTGNAIAPAGSDTHTITLPRGWIKGILIKVGTAITVSAGAVVANCSIKTIILRYNGVQIFYITGNSVDDLPSAGIQLIRELNAQVQKAAVTAEYIYLNFPFPLPPADVQLQWINQSAQNIGANVGGTVTAGDHDILVDWVNSGNANPIIPFITCTNFADLALTGDRYHYMTSTPKKLRMLLFVTHDAGVRSDTTYARLTVKDKTKTYFDGSMADLKDVQLSKSGLALNTGCFILTFGKDGIDVPPDTLCLLFNATVAGVTKTIEYLAYCY